MLATATQPTSRIIAPYKALDWQTAPFRDKSPVLLLTGSAGGGKSKLAAEKLHAFCLKYPGATAMMLRKTRESMTNSTVLFFERKIVGKDPSVKHRAQLHRFEYANGSILAYGGMKDDEQREQVRGVGQDGGIDICWMEEATQFTEQDFNELTARMRGKAANWRQLLLTTNPANPSHWIYKRLIQQGEAQTYYSAASDNAYNPSDYLATLDRLTGVLRDRLRDGKWVQAEGAVYPMWNPEIHLRDPFFVPSNWRVIVGVDWGFTNPGVLGVWAIDHDDRMYLVREHYYTQRAIAEWVHLAQDIQIRYRPEAFVCDPSEPMFISMFQQAGLNAVGAMNDVVPGIQAVTERLKVAGDGLPRLFIVRGALVETDPTLEQRKLPTCLLEEIDGYVWQKVSENKAQKEQPLKMNDHAADACRYVCAYLDLSAGDTLTRAWDNPLAEYRG